MNMKQIACTFDDSYYRLCRVVYFIVDDEYSMYGSFVDNHSFHQMKKKEKMGYRPISVLKDDPYGKKIYDTLTKLNSVHNDRICIEATIISYIQKD